MHKQQEILTVKETEILTYESDINTISLMTSTPSRLK